MMEREREKWRKREGFEVSRCVVHTCSEIALKNVRNKGGRGRSRAGHAQLNNQRSKLSLPPNEYF